LTPKTKQGPAATVPDNRDIPSVDFSEQSYAYLKETGAAGQSPNDVRISMVARPTQSLTYEPASSLKSREEPLQRAVSIDACTQRSNWSCPTEWQDGPAPGSPEYLGSPLASPVSPRSIKAVFWNR
jgi:hypothetical protein